MHCARYEKPLLMFGLKRKHIPFQSSGARPQGKGTPKKPYHNKARKKIEEPSKTDSCRMAKIACKKLR